MGKARSSGSAGQGHPPGRQQFPTSGPAHMKIRFVFLLFELLSKSQRFPRVPKFCPSRLARPLSQWPQPQGQNVASSWGPSPARGFSFLATCPGPMRSAHSPLGGSGQSTQTDIHPNHGLRGPAAHCRSTDAAAQRWELPSTTGTGKRKAWATEAEHNSGQGQTKWQGLTSSQERPCGRDQPALSQIGMRFLTRWAQVRRAPGFQWAGSWGTASRGRFSWGRSVGWPNRRQAVGRA